MQVGDLVTVLVNWGRIGTKALISDVRIEGTSDIGVERVVITLHNGWEYHPWELKVISHASR